MIRKLWPQTRKSHPLSKLLRPVFEGKKPKKIFGVLLVFVIMLSGFFIPPASSLVAYQNEELITLTTKAEVTTQLQKHPEFPFLLSLDCQFSQGFWSFHPANDIACPWGTPVQTITKGKVIIVGYDRFGHGNKVVIDHGGNIQSLYAHLSRIEVKEGDEVTQETTIGRVGSTGWTTGAHLHLEIQENGKHLNPRVFLANLD